MPRRDLVRWTPRVELTAVEEKICRSCARTGRLYPFLRRHRHELFDDAFQSELAEIYVDSPMGQPPVAPALLALVTILQAADGVSDAAAVNEALFDHRWQMVLDCLGVEEAPFSQGLLVNFRRRLVASGLHQRLVERSVELAQRTGDFGFSQLRVALDSAPLWGAGRVEDTFNLIGHALSVVVTCVAVVVGRPAEEVREAARLRLLGQSSLKAALDIDWDDPDEQHRALQELLAEAGRLRRWLGAELAKEELARSPLREALEQLERVVSQDLEPDPDRGGERIAVGTAKDRQISIHDASMRHGRKSRSTVIKGFKRFVARELDHGLIVGVTVQPANQPEHEATEALRRQVEVHGKVGELSIDRGFLAGGWTSELHGAGGVIHCRPWPARNRGLFTKEDFRIDLEAGSVTCPAGEERPIQGPVVRFPSSTCEACALRPKCTRARPGQGRTVTIHEQEGLLQHLRVARRTPEGRKKLRERVPVEHALAHICNRQGTHARYVGLEKNVFDLCRYAFIENCFAIDRMERAAA